MDHFDQHDFAYEQQYAQAKQRFFARTYGVMAGGLLLTFSMALLVALCFPAVAYSAPLIMLFCVAEIVTVVVFTRRISYASYHSALSMFFFYSALTGVTLSSLFLVFDISSIFTCFLASAAAFGVMALLGLSTQRDLSPMRSLLYGGLVGLIFSSLLCLFFRFSGLDMLINIVGILLFMGMTAYDNQKLSRMYDQVAGTEIAGRYAVFSALQLYLDFINLFTYLLSLLGNSKRR